MSETAMRLVLVIADPGRTRGRKTEWANMVIPSCGFCLLCFFTMTPWDRRNILLNESLMPTFRSTQERGLGPDPPYAYASTNLTALYMVICEHAIHHLLDCRG